MPSITVLLAVHNGEVWLEQAVESVLSQSYTNYEFLIIDDGSSDQTPSILRSYTLLDHRIRVITQSNSGLVHSLNRGLSEAQAPWILRLDADDYCLPERLAAQVAFAASNTNLAAFGSSFIRVDHAGRELDLWRLQGDHTEILDRLLTSRTFFPHSSVCFSRQKALAVGGYTLAMRRAQDTDLWLRLSEVGTLAVLPEPYVAIRIHPQQISAEDCGREQLIFGWMAVVAYELRKHAFIDPLSTPELSQSFKSFIDVEMTFAGIHRLVQIKRQLKQLFRSSAIFKDISLFAGLLLRLILSPKIIAFLLFERTINQRLRLLLSARWIQIS